MHSDDLASLPLPGLLHRLHARGASGVLIVERTGGRTAVQLRNGSFVSTTSGTNLESFEDFLVRTKRIDQEQREAFIDQMSVGTGSRSEILIGMGVMSESEVTAALFDHADQGLVDAFAWPAPRLRFLPGKKLKPSNSTELNRSVGSTILRGVMARLPIETIRAALEEKGPLFVVEGEDPLYPLEELELDSSQKAFLEEIDADRTVSDLRADGEAVERMLYGFSSIGMVELSAEPPLMLMDVVEQEAEPEKPDAQPSVAPSDEGDADRAKLSPSDPRVEGTSALETLRGMLSDLVERMSAQDDFEVLGIAETATDTQVQTAHDEQLRSLHLERILAQHPDLRALVDAAGERLATALENLRTAELRSGMVAQRLEHKKSEEAEKLAKRALEAESWFRKGDRFLTQRSYEKAVEAFGMAAHLDPTEGEYVAHLGYSLYLSKPDDVVIQRESLEHIAKGIKMSPEREKSFLFLGRIFKAIGQTKNARGMFRRALKIRPEFHPAKQELRLLNMRERKKQKKGFLDRLAKK
jgi:hypothetical protein